MFPCSAHRLNDCRYCSGDSFIADVRRRESYWLHGHWVIAGRDRLGEQAGEQGNEGCADEGNAAASHELFYP